MQLTEYCYCNQNVYHTVLIEHTIHHKLQNSELTHTPYLQSISVVSNGEWPCLRIQESGSTPTAVIWCGTYYRQYVPGVTSMIYTSNSIK